VELRLVERLLPVTETARSRRAGSGRSCFGEAKWARVIDGRRIGGRLAAKAHAVRPGGAGSAVGGADVGGTGEPIGTHLALCARDEIRDPGSAAGMPHHHGRRHLRIDS